MGEVYKARDARLNRTVAVKVLPEALTGDDERRKRLLREARTASALNHSNIVTIYDIVSEDGRDSIVMEYVEGRTMEEAIGRKGLPLAEVLQYGIQISNAMAAAHAAGIIHRDLKPGNIMVTKSGVKVLDFGLAKFARTAMTMLEPTETLTAEQAIVGTLAYMAPEQLAGKPCDERTDIFALGLVLYQMAGGRRAFGGNSRAELIADIMRCEPPALENVPAQFAHVVAGCLAKDPEDRRQSAHDLAVELRWIQQAQAALPLTTTPQNTAPGGWRRHERAGWLVAVIGLILALGLSRFSPTREHPDSPSVEFTVPLPEDSTSFLRESFSVSPRGTELAWLALGRDGKVHLWVRPMGSSVARLLPDSAGTTQFFWSGDNRHLAFFSRGKLHKIDSQGGPASDLCDVPDSMAVGAWGPDGNILFASMSSDAWYRVSDQGGAAERMEAFPKRAVGGPHFLPGSRRFLIQVTTDKGPAIFLGSLGRSEGKLLMQGRGGFYSRAAGASANYILFERNGLVMGQQFDADREQLTGEPFALTAKQVSAFSASENGTLAYRADTSGAQSTLIWMDRKGQRIGTLPERGDYRQMSLSPDEAMLAISRMDYNSSLWRVELARGTSTRLTSDPANHWYPVWSPDGQKIAYSLWDAAKPNLYTHEATGGGTDRPMLQATGLTHASSWSPDGRFLAYTMENLKTKDDVWILPVHGEGQPFALLRTEFNELQAAFSPDGHWIAYTSDESGRQEVYVRKFEGGPAFAGGRLISIGGGSLPKWRRDGKELFYLSPERKLMAVDIDTSSVLTAGLPQPLFQTKVHMADYLVSYAVAANGQQFLLNTPAEEMESSPITVIVNWKPGDKR
jgi:serine/threonine protein kinase